MSRKPAVKQHGNSARTRGRPFPKGVSGNPRGRPRLGLAIAEEVRDFLSDDDPRRKMQRVRVLLLKLYARAAAGDVRAASELLDRGWGKPVQALKDVTPTPIMVRIDR